MKTKKYKIPVGVYDSTVYLVLSDNPDKTYKTLAKKYNWFEEDDEETNSAYFNSTSDFEYFIVMPFNPGIVTIAHEALHGTFAILKDHGVTLSPDSEEAFTYLHDFLVGKIQDKL